MVESSIINRDEVFEACQGPLKEYGHRTPNEYLNMARDLLATPLVKSLKGSLTGKGMYNVEFIEKIRGDVGED